MGKPNQDRHVERQLTEPVAAVTAGRGVVVKTQLGETGGGGGNTMFIPPTLGAALIEGYDAIGLCTSLGRPFLRKDMEIKMKEFCAGAKSRNDFVHKTVKQYRDITVRSQQQDRRFEGCMSPSFFF